MSSHIISHIITMVNNRYPEAQIETMTVGSMASITVYYRKKSLNLPKPSIQINSRNYPIQTVEKIWDFCQYCARFGHQFATYEAYLKGKETPLWRLLND